MRFFFANGFLATFPIVSVFLAWGSVAHANPLTLDWVSAGNNPVGGYYVSPYTAEIKSTSQLITLYCIDFNHEVAPPLEWEANIVPLNLAEVPLLQYGNLSGTNSTWIKYEAAAWLISQLTGTPDPYQQAVFQYAAWNIFLDPGHTPAYDNSVGLGSPFAAQVTSAYNNAFNAVNNGYTPTVWSVVTPDPNQQPGSTQEFLTPGIGYNPVATPEPVSIVLLGTVLLGFVAVARWQMKRRAARTLQP
jgi:hypothetical protein